MQKVNDILYKCFGGHINLGRKVTIYGLNAMQWAINIRTKRWGIVCFRLPLPCFNKFPPLYFYVSPNGTPRASTFCIGRGKKQRQLARIRRKTFGHNFDSWNDPILKEKLWKINDKY